MGHGRRVSPRSAASTAQPWVGSGVVGYSLPFTCDLHRSNPRKEVIQPQLPLQLPCYDFVPVTGPALDSCLLAVSPTGFRRDQLP